MQIEFISKIRAANNNGTGFCSVPKEKSRIINIHENVEVLLNGEKFFSQIIKYGSVGIYIPKEITKEFLGKELCIKLKKINECYAKVGYDGRIYIPSYKAEELKLKDKDIVVIKIIQNTGEVKEKYSKVITRKQGTKTEFMCFIGNDLAKTMISFGIKKTDQNNKSNSSLINRLLKLDLNFANTKDGNIIIFKDRKYPIVINPKIKLSDVALYMGSYYSDGIKKGNSWGICASTFEQANYYIKMHNTLIKHPKIDFSISYTDVRNEDLEKLTKNLKSIWSKKVGNYNYKFRIRKPEGLIFTKCTKYGTLVLKEHRMAILDFYNFLLQDLISEIKTKKDTDLAVDFICGILEGDGSAGRKDRGHVSISSDLKGHYTICDILDVIGIKYKVTKEAENKIDIRIGVLEILRNFDLFKDKIFIYYPKRRKLLFERMQTVGAVKFLLYKRTPVSWVKTWLKENNFVDNEYNVTKKGIKLRKDLQYRIKSVTVK